MAALSIVFWFLVFLIFYTYLGYPLLLYISSFVRRQSVLVGNELPSLSIIIPAYNEEKVIARKLENTLSADYPQELLEIIVVSDASTDKTNEVVDNFKERGAQLIVNRERRGKTYSLNQAVKIATGDILVFTDANAMFEKGSFRELVRGFADPQIGLITGSTRYFTRGEDESVVMTMSSYTRFERFIKVLETQIASCVGADGAIFGLRKKLYRPLAETDINDFVMPLDVIRQGYRVIFNDRAFSVEEHPHNESEEFQRQVRIANRTIRGIIAHRDVLNPFRHGVFSLMLWSHKVMRFMFPWFIMLLLIVSMALSFYAGYFYKAAFGGFCGLTILSVLSRRLGWRYFSFLRAFVYTNEAILVAWKSVVANQTIVTWERSSDG